VEVDIGQNGNGVTAVTEGLIDVAGTYRCRQRRQVVQGCYLRGHEGSYLKVLEPARGCARATAGVSGRWKCSRRAGGRQWARQQLHCALLTRM
ncbi:hypothetical protein RZS08_46180, partial [Arthrospira platensis SPKY1]|nr:hypothetical protein [Arthrospira platensis SPKY1]